MTPFQVLLEGKTGILTGGTDGSGSPWRGAPGPGRRDYEVFSADELSDAGRAELQIGGETDSNTAFWTSPPGRVRGDGRPDRGALRQADSWSPTPASRSSSRNRFSGLSIARLEEAMRTQFAVFPIAFASLAVAAARVMAPRFEKIEPDSSGHRPDSGAIVVTLSETSLCPLRDDLLAYAAAKRASLSVMESLAATLGPSNIRVNGVAPGFANTAGPRKFYDRHPDIRADIEARAHLKPAFLDPGVPAVLYLLTDNYTTGQVIALDGGYRIELKRYFQDTPGTPREKQ